MFIGNGSAVDVNEVNEHLDLGRAHAVAGRWDLALTEFQKGLALRGDHADLLVEHGKMLLYLGRASEAVGSFRSAVSIRPVDVDACRYLLCALELLGQTKESTGVWCHLAEIHRRATRYREASHAYKQALTGKPDCLRALIGLGRVHLGLADPPAAMRCFASALSLDPGHSQVHVDLGSALHLMGDAQSGWNEFRWYYDDHKIRLREFEQPLWDGSQMPNATVLAWTEMGRGDVIQFLRYLPFIRARCARLIVQVNHAGLAPLVERLPCVASVVPPGAPLPYFDAHVPILFFPALFPECRTSIPDTPYLQADPLQQNVWRRHLALDGRQLIGLSWTGNSETFSAASRFMTLGDLAPLAGLKNIRFISLQHGVKAADLASAPEGLRVEHFVQESTSIAEVAALITNLDLVISVDTMVAHLAGALGKPVWTLLRHATNWRWGLAGDSTPWYSTMRLFRQQHRGDWLSVCRQVRLALETSR